MPAYRFVQNNGGHFRLCVFAKSERAARQYVKNQAMSSLSHRALRFAGKGEPSDPQNWCAASVKEDKHGVIA